MGCNTQKRGPSDQRLSYIVKNVWNSAINRYVHMTLSLKTRKKTKINVCVFVEGTFKIKIQNVILEKTEGDIQRHLQLSELKSIPCTDSKQIPGL